MKRLKIGAGVQGVIVPALALVPFFLSLDKNQEQLPMRSHRPFMAPNSTGCQP